MAMMLTDRPVTREAVEDRVLSDARRTFADTPEPVLEGCVRQALDTLWVDDPRVMTFIPVLALREVRALLDDRSASVA